MDHKIIYWGLAMLLYVQMVAADVYPNAIVVAKFPDGVFDSEQTLSYEDLIRQCNAAITNMSTTAEKFACSLVAMPGTGKKALVGLYPASTGLDTFPGSLTDSTLSPIFDEYALPKMIHEGCVSFTPSSWEGEYATSRYLDSEEYTQMIQKQFETKNSLELGFGPFSFTIGYTQKQLDRKTTTSITGNAGFVRIWRHDIGVVSFGKCIHKYVKKTFVDKWRHYSNPSDRNIRPESFITREFDELAQLGFYFPTAFAYAIQYGTKIDMEYKSDSESVIHQVSNALTLGVDASFKYGSVGTSAHVASDIRKFAKQQGVQIRVTEQEFKNGNCQFKELLEDRANKWAEILDECVAKSGSVDTFERPAYIPKGGFNSIKELLNEQGLNMDSPRLRAALLVNFGYCQVDSSGGYFTHCYLADGSHLYNAYRFKQMDTTWRLIDDVTFLTNRNGQRDAIFKNLCDSCSE